VTQEWLNALTGVALRHPNVILYVFGSTVYGDRTPNDLDLLAVYSTLEDYYAFHAELEQLEFSPLVDVVAMGSDELESSGFIQRSNAVALKSLVVANLTRRYRKN